MQSAPLSSAPNSLHRPPRISEPKAMALWDGIAVFQTPSNAQQGRNGQSALAPRKSLKTLDDASARAERPGASIYSLFLPRYAVPRPERQRTARTGGDIVAAEARS